MTEITRGSKNVYEDLVFPDAEEMLIKAKLAIRIGQIIEKRKLTQKEAAKISDMRRGRFRGISQAKMLECLAALGNDIEIRIKPIRRKKATGSLNVVFAG